MEALYLAGAAVWVGLNIGVGNFVALIAVAGTVATSLDDVISCGHEFVKCNLN